MDALDRHGSFAAAAAALFKTPSALSYMVQKLENDLDITCWTAPATGREFTDTGKLMLEKAGVLLRAAQDLGSRRYVENGWESEITLGIDASFPFAACCH